MKVVDTYHPISTGPDLEEKATSKYKPSLIFKRRQFHQPLPPAKKSRFKEYWSRALLKIKFKRSVEIIKEQTGLYGTSNHISDMGHNITAKLEELVDNIYNKKERFRTAQVVTPEQKIPKYLIDPNGTFKQTWTVIFSVALIYTALVMPYRLAFVETVFFDAGTILEILVDFLFILDICFNFFTPYKDKNSKFRTRMTDIAKHYIRGAFLVDALASTPFIIIEYFHPETHDYRQNTLLRLVNSPRLYNMLRIIRLAKLFKYLKKKQYIEKLQDFLNINSRVYKLVRFLMTIFLCVHIVGCLWFFSSKLDGFGPDTWVFKNGYMDKDSGTLYLASVYWAFTTITTVGYGDISATTTLEKLISIIWMVIGVGFYSVTVGSLSSFFSAIDTTDSVLSAKIAALHEFAKEAGLSKDLKMKIKQNIRYSTSKLGTIWSKKHDLFKDIPKEMKSKVVNSIYGGIFRHMWFFKNRDPSFVTSLIPLLKPLQKMNDEYLYMKGQYANEVYFITKGRVNLVLSDGLTYKSYLKHSHVGEIEIVLQLTYRDDTAQVCGRTEFLCIEKNNFLNVVNYFEYERRDIQAIAVERRRRNSNAMKEVDDVLQLKEKFGDIKFLAGQKVYHDDAANSNAFNRSQSSNAFLSNIHQRFDQLDLELKMLLSVLQP